MNLEELLLNGALEREPSTSAEIERLLQSAQRRIDDASSQSIHPETRLAQAYEAIRLCATVALRAQHLRARNDRGKHYVTIETLRHTLGLPHDLIDYFQILRDVRHKALYEGESNVTENQVNEALQETTDLLRRLRQWLNDRQI